MAASVPAVIEEPTATPAAVGRAAWLGDTPTEVWAPLLRVPGYLTWDLGQRGYQVGVLRGYLLGGRRG